MSIEFEIWASGAVEELTQVASDMQHRGIPVSTIERTLLKLAVAYNTLAPEDRPRLVTEVLSKIRVLDKTQAALTMPEPHCPEGDDRPSASTEFGTISSHQGKHLLAGVQIACDVLQRNHEELQAAHSALRFEHEDLRRAYNVLQRKHEDLQAVRKLQKSEEDRAPTSDRFLTAKSLRPSLHPAWLEPFISQRNERSCHAHDGVWRIEIEELGSIRFRITDGILSRYSTSDVTGGKIGPRMSADLLYCDATTQITPEQFDAAISDPAQPYPKPLAALVDAPHTL